MPNLPRKQKYQNGKEIQNALSTLQSSQRIQFNRLIDTGVDK